MSHDVEQIAKRLHDAGWSIDDVEKHLLGRHNQDDHDPTGGHSRSEHGTGQAAVTGGTLGGILGAGTGHQSSVGEALQRIGMDQAGYPVDMTRPNYRAGRFFSRRPGAATAVGAAAGLGIGALTGAMTAPSRHGRDAEAVRRQGPVIQRPAGLEERMAFDRQYGPSSFNPEATRPRGKNTAYRRDKNYASTDPTKERERAERGVADTRGFRSGSPQFTMRS